VKVLCVGAVKRGQQTGGLGADCDSKVTSVEYVKPVANVNSTWQTPALVLLMEMLCPATEYEGPSSVAHGPETATFVRCVAEQDRLNVAKPYGIPQETVHAKPPPSQPTTSDPPATTAKAIAR